MYVTLAEILIDMPQISASVKENTIEVIKEIANEEKRSFSAMVEIILSNAAASWIQAKSPAPKKKMSSKPKK